MRHENDLEFAILGPLGVRYRGGRVPIRGSRERMVLASLLLAEGSAVSLDRLVETLWDADPPRAAAKAVRNSVSALRQRFAAAGASASVIDTEPDGYRLRLHDCYLDAQDFQGRTADARQVAAANQPAQAVTALRAALGLWQGQALQGLRSPVIEAGAASLNEQRLAALEECLDLELALGRNTQVVSELRVLAAEHPLRERLAGQLMIALYRSGRQAEALETYHQLAGRLADDLGLDPATEIATLHQAILRQDPTLAASSAVASAVASAAGDTGASALAAPRDPGPAPEAVPVEQEHLPETRRRRRLRMPRSLVLGCAAAVALATLVAWTVATGPPKTPAVAADGPPRTTNRPVIAPEPERRHGPLIMMPGQVADLDSMASSWGIAKAPGFASDDVWFSITDFGLHGDGNADIAILPAGSVGTFDECAKDQKYGASLDARHIRPGQLVCDITTENPVALLRIVDVQYTASGVPDQITFDAVVWVRLHTT